MSLVRDAERLVTRINAARLGLSLPPIFLGHAARQLVAVKPGAGRSAGRNPGAECTGVASAAASWARARKVTGSAVWSALRLNCADLASRTASPGVRRVAFGG